MTFRIPAALKILLFFFCQKVLIFHSSDQKRLGLCRNIPGCNMVQLSWFGKSLLKQMLPDIYFINCVADISEGDSVHLIIICNCHYSLLHRVPCAVSSRMIPWHFHSSRISSLRA